MKIEIDVIILSNGKNKNLVELTNQTIQSLINSENTSKISFKILVIESNTSLKPFQYRNSKTIYPKQKFGFHRYLNIGVKLTNNELICFCNNDLIFHKGWATSILAALQKDTEIFCANTFCPNFHSDKLSEIPYKINYGYKNGVLFTGWCFLVKRTVFEIVGSFDEKFTFWYADDDFRLSLQKHNVKNALIKDAQVTHIGSSTLNKEADNKQYRLQYSAYAYYKYKWEHKQFWKYLLHQTKYLFNSSIRKISSTKKN